MYIGANNYSAYDPEFCDGHYCPRDCECCQIADKILEYEEKVNSSHDGPQCPTEM